MTIYLFFHLSTSEEGVVEDGEDDEDSISTLQGDQQAVEAARRLLPK